MYFKVHLPRINLYVKKDQPITHEFDFCFTSVWIPHYHKEHAFDVCMICNCQHHLVTETCLVLHIQGAATLIYQFSCSRVHYPLSQYVRHCTCAVTSGMKTPPIQLIQCVFAVAPVSHRSCMSARL